MLIKDHSVVPVKPAKAYDPKQLIDMIWRGIIGAITLLRLVLQSGTSDIYKQTEIIEK